MSRSSDYSGRDYGLVDESGPVSLFADQGERRRHAALSLATKYLDSSCWANPSAKAVDTAKEFENYLKGEEEKK